MKLLYNNATRLSIVCLNAFIFASASVGADVPHEFQAGAVVKASEVNENFQNLDQRIEEVDINKPTFILESETESPNGIDRTYVFSLEDDIKIGQLFASDSLQSGLTLEGGTLLAGDAALNTNSTPLVFSPDVNRVSLTLEVASALTDVSTAIAATDTSGNLGKISFTIPKLDTGLVSGNYTLNSSITLPVVPVSDEMMALNNRQCYLTSSGAPVMDSLTLGQSISFNKIFSVSLSVDEGGDLGFVSLVVGDEFTSPFSSEIRFRSTLGRQTSGPYGYTTTTVGGTLNQLSATEISFSMEVLCDENGNETSYEISGTGALKFEFPGG
jgi:hypothetical protein